MTEALYWASERSTPPPKPEWQTRVKNPSVTMKLAHALPRTRGKPCDIRQPSGSGRQRPNQQKPAFSKSSKNASKPPKPSWFRGLFVELVT